MTFKRWKQEAGLTEADYDFLLPLSDSIMTVQARRPRRHHQDSHTTVHTRRPTALVPTALAPNACTVTFGIAELAEMIFLRLPAENLLCKVQRVSRSWREVVQSNNLIQQYLFFSPVPLQGRSDIKKILIPPARFARNAPIREPEDGEQWVSGGWLQIENPWLYLFSSALANSEPFQREGASWRRMLVQQPPESFAHYSTVDDEEARLYRKFMQDNPTRNLSENPHNPYPRGIKKFEERPISAGVTNGGFDLVRLGHFAMDKELYSIDYWYSWKPLFDWETMADVKQLRRIAETFVELELVESDSSEDDR